MRLNNGEVRGRKQWGEGKTCQAAGRHLEAFFPAEAFLYSSVIISAEEEMLCKFYFSLPLKLLAEIWQKIKINK